MDAENKRELIEKYQAGTALPEEIALIERWIILGTVKELDLSDEDLRNDFFIMRSRLPLKYKTAKRVNLWRYIGGVAAAVAIISGVWWFSSGNSGEGDKRRVTKYAMDIAPGKNTATITLPNGKIITLSDKKDGITINSSNLSYNDGTELASSFQERTEREPEQMLTAATPRGGTYQVTLSDGTKVWLNADSKISFPSQFSGAQREVNLLNGEAYFEVTKDKTHAFVVLTKDQRLEVLGTHFNISAYGEEKKTQTTLLEGAVKISLSKAEKQSTTIKLHPGQQAILSNHIFKVASVNTDLAVDWKNGDFIFRDEALETVMQKVARWYDVEIVYKNDYPQQVKLGGFISRNKDLSAVLQLIESTGKVHFEIKNKSVIVGK